MRYFTLVLLALTLTACSSAPRQEATSFFSLPHLEGRVEEEVVRVPSSWANSQVSIGLVVVGPQAYKGKTVVFRFKSREDPSYRLLASSPGQLFMVSVKDGKGCFSNNVIMFVSDETPQFTKRPSQAREPTSGLPPAAASAFVETTVDTSTFVPLRGTAAGKHLWR